jgi:hypothetical protein
MARAWIHLIQPDAPAHVKKGSDPRASSGTGSATHPATAFGVPELGGDSSPQEPLEPLGVLPLPPENRPGQTEFRDPTAGIRIGVLGSDPIGQRPRPG